MTWAQLLRLRALEIVALWEGAVMTQDLVQCFGVSRTIASKDFARYRDTVPENLVYDTSLRAYRPTPEFRPRFSTGTLAEYHTLMDSPWEVAQPSFLVFLSLLTLPADPACLNPVFRAARKRLGLRIKPKTRPDAEAQVFYPHRVIRSGFRWLVRGYLDTEKRFETLVLSETVMEPAGSAIAPFRATPGNDTDWNCKVILELVPAPEAAAPGSESLAPVSVTVSEALVPYLLETYRVRETEKAS